MSTSSAAVSHLSRFFSVPARIKGRVVCRLARSGIVWAWRAPRAGQQPSPAALFIPCPSFTSAAAVAKAAGYLGWSPVIKAGTSCACYQAGPLAADPPPYVVKVILPANIRAAQGAQRVEDIAAVLAVAPFEA
jgi:hypothetical protein